jgi:hypothetical protein
MWCSYYYWLHDDDLECDDKDECEEFPIYQMWLDNEDYD